METDYSSPPKFYDNGREVRSHTTPYNLNLPGGKDRSLNDLRWIFQSCKCKLLLALQKLHSKQTLSNFSTDRHFNRGIKKLHPCLGAFWRWTCPEWGYPAGVFILSMLFPYISNRLASCCIWLCGSPTFSCTCCCCTWLFLWECRCIVLQPRPLNLKWGQPCLQYSCQSPKNSPGSWPSRNHEGNQEQD